MSLKNAFQNDEVKRDDINDYDEGGVGLKARASSFLNSDTRVIESFSNYEDNMKQIINQVYDRAIKMINESTTYGMPEKDIQNLTLMVGILKDVTTQMSMMNHLNEQMRIFRQEMDVNRALMRENDALKRKLLAPWYKRIFS